MIRFDVLGAVDLRRADGAQLDHLLRQPKRLALLAYLVIPAPGTWHRRDILLAVFWPDLETGRARTSLRNALYVIRQALGDGVLQSRGDEEVSVDSAALETDLAPLWDALRAGRSEEALARYRGELIPGLYPPESEGFLPWLEGERARLRNEVTRAGAKWTEALEREGRLPEALAAARRVLEISPHDETAARRVMQVHGRMGDHAGGLAFFEEYSQRLHREFEADPAPETVALAERMRRSNAGIEPSRQAGFSTPGPSSESSGAPTPTVRRPPIGRVVLLAGTVVLALAALAWALRRSDFQPLGIGRSTPVTADEGLQIEPAISPNGRVVAYVGGSAERMRIFITRVDGGAPWPLTGDSNSVELLPRWSPDNDRVVFLAGNGAWVSPAIGGRPRLAAPGGPGDAGVRSASWAPHGDSIAIVRNDSLLVQSLEGPGTRLVGRGSQLHSCAWSPNGSWIACVSGNWVSLVPGTLFGNRAPSALLLYPASGGMAIALTDREKEYLSPSWSGDGRFLWMLSNREGPSGEVFALPIGGDGHPAGSFARIGLTAEAISLVEGRIAYSVYSRSSNVWSLPIPSGSSAPPVSVAGAQRVTSGNQIVEVLKVSPDAKWLIYDSNLRGNSDIYRVPLGAPEAGSERLTDDGRPEFAGALSPDGHLIAYHRWEAGERRVFTRRLEDGATTAVLSRPGDQGVPRWSPDGSALAIWTHQREEGTVLVVRRDQKGGWASPEWELPNAQLPAWAPDGRSIAFVTLAGSIEVIAADSGARRVLYAPGAQRDDPIATYLAWDAGRTEIWFLGHDAAGRGGIWALPIHGGRPRQIVDLRDPAGRLNGPAFTSDGTRFYFTLDERRGNIWWAELVAR